MTFDPIRSPVDYILLAGQRSPGIAEVHGASSPRRWDERKGYAQSGSLVVFRGVGLARFRVLLTLLTEDDWSAWHEWRDLVQRPPIGERARAKDIWHPILEDLGIASAVVEDVLQPEQDDKGEWVIEIRFIEHRMPVPRIESITASETEQLTGLDLEIETNRRQIRLQQAILNHQNARLYAAEQSQTVAAE